MFFGPIIAHANGRLLNSNVAFIGYVALWIDRTSSVLPPGPAQGAVPRDAEGAGERTQSVRLQTPLDELRVP